MKFETHCDMGSIKIFNDSMSAFFMNDIGDGLNTVEIITKKKGGPYKHPKGKYLGHFTVKTEAFLSNYDCEDVSIYTFKRGRWFVYLVNAIDNRFKIVKYDEDTWS